jgi:hypothetical protein
MAIIKRYDKIFADFLLKHCNDIYIPKYITVSPCGINHEPLFELWETEPWIGRCSFCDWHWDWVGSGNITFHTNTVKDLNRLGRILFSKEISKKSHWDINNCIIQLYED